MQFEYRSYRLSPAARRLRLSRSRIDSPTSIQSPEQHLEVIADVLHSAGVAVVFDIHPGSCTVGVQLRRAGYANRIITFEPSPDAWEQLRFCSMTDEQWHISRSAIRLHGEVSFADGGLPILGAPLETTLEVFCDDDDVVAVWLSKPQECFLLEPILTHPVVRFVSVACTISDNEENACMIEQTLMTHREQKWGTIAVHSRHTSQSGPLPVVDVIAVRMV